MVYSNSCCSCSFEHEIIKIGQLSHKVYSKNILNFQGSTIVLNACTKTVWKLIEGTIYIYIYIYIYLSEFIFKFLSRCIYLSSLSLYLSLSLSLSLSYLISDVLLWTPSYGRAKAGRPARTYIQQLCEDTGCGPEDLPEAMNDREKWRERVRDICDYGTT